MSAMHRASTMHGRGVRTDCILAIHCRGSHVSHVSHVSSPIRVVREERTACLVSRSLVMTRATGTGGGADVLDRPRTTPGEPKTRRRRGRPSIYKVLLHNDDYNKREYVVQVLLKHVEGYTVEDALNVMREAHEHGLALVCECAQDRAEETCESLRLCGLICTIEPR